MSVAPYIATLLAFLNAFYSIFSSQNLSKLDDFIAEYQNHSIELIATFVAGLKKDYKAVRNSIIYNHITNGPMEGTNNKLKMLRRRGYGRSEIELLNALAVLPWHYKDIDKKTA
jgi:transposase